jgi:hypothetical protein
MSRAPNNPGEPIYIKPANDIYTVLVAVATVVAILGLIVWYVKMGDLFGGVFTAPPSIR